VAWSQNEGRLAASAGKVLRIWNAGNGGMFQGVAEFKDHPSTISAICWAPRQGGILAACYGGVRLWRIGQAEPVRLFPYQGAVVSLALDAEGSFLAIGSLDASVHLFRTDTDQNWHMSGYPGKVRAVAFDAEGLNLYTVAAESLVVWNMNKFEGTSGRLFKGHVGWVQELACHPAAPVVATVGEDGLLCLWEPSTTKPMLTREVSDTGALSCVAWSSDGQWLATGADDGRVTIFKMEGLRA
jgi:WD40 repeat protein